MKVWNASIVVLFFLAACSQPRIVPLRDRSSDPNGRLLARLKAPMRPSALIAENETIKKILADLSEQNNIAMVVDWNALEFAGVRKTQECSFSLHELPLGVALTTILADLKSTAPLEFAARNGVLRISLRTDLAANNPDTQYYITRTYDIRDLQVPVPANGAFKDKNGRMVYLIDFIVHHVAPTTWEIKQYPDDLTLNIPVDPYMLSGIEHPDAHKEHGVISAFDSSLVVTQTRKIHTQIADLLSQLRRPLTPGSPP